MKNSISTCIWFDGKAKEAFLFYKEVFGDVELISENPFTVNYNLFGRRFMHLNGGPGFPINPSISFFISATNQAELSTIWEKLIQGGKALMPLGAYPWSAQYGWCADQFGINWQLMIGHESSCKVMPHLMFTGDNSGKAAQAIDFYTGLFKESKVVNISHYEEGEPDITGNIKYAQFELNGLPFGAMDSAANHGFDFNEGVSFIITLDTQVEIDRYWEIFSNGGKPGKCGWIKDKYGVSWQVVPSILGKYMSNPVTAPKATYAFMQMSKFIIADLEKAVE